MTSILSDIDVHEISIVDKAANKRKFLILKNDEPGYVLSSSELNNSPFPNHLTKNEQNDKNAQPTVEITLGGNMAKNSDKTPDNLQAMIKQALEKESFKESKSFFIKKGMNEHFAERLAACVSILKEDEASKDPAVIAAVAENLGVPQKDETKDVAATPVDNKETQESVTTDPKTTEITPNADVKTENSPTDIQEDKEEKKDETSSSSTTSPNLEQSDIIKADGSLNVDNIPEAMRAPLQVIYKAHQETLKKAQVLEEKLNKELEEKEHKAFIAKAQEFKNLSVETHSLAEILKTAHKKFSNSLYNELEKILKTANESSAHIMTEIGQSGNTDISSLDAHQKLEERAKEIQKSEGITSFHKAYAEAMKRFPDIFAETRDELNINRRK